MSAIALVAGAGAGLGDGHGHPGDDDGARRRHWHDAHRRLAVASHPWEDELSGLPLHVEHDLVVAADASLYQRETLLRRLAARGIDPAGQGAAALIAAAYRAFGESLGARLRGDVAFVVLDLARGRLVAARDFVGRRALHFGWRDGRLAIASAPEAVAERLAGERRWNVAHLAGRAAGLLEAWDTAHEGVAPLAAGHTLVADLLGDGTVGRPTLRRHWLPPTFERRGLPFAAAVERLRAILGEAVADRLAPDGATAVWLSGGYDSPAVYAAGQGALRERGEERRLVAVSMSYPPGDPGREDELIEEAVARWGGPVVWRQVDDAPLFGDAPRGARRRAEPFAHAFEGWMTSLAVAARDAGARVVLDGSGGDQLFQVSPVFLADLVRAGRWRDARAEWRALGLGGAGWRRFARAGVLPLLPAAAWRAAGLLRGRPIRGLRAGTVPSWIRRPWRDELTARAELRLARRRGERESARESRWYFETSYSASVLAEQRAIVRRAGVEVRSPLLDARVVELAATRPREERAGGGESKRLLRAATAGLLPETVLSPRRSRTGITSHYYRRAMLRELPGVVAGVLEEPLLASLGVLDPGEYQSSAERYRRGGDAELGAALFATAQTELWLRTRA